MEILKVTLEKLTYEQVLKNISFTGYLAGYRKLLTREFYLRRDQRIWSIPLTSKDVIEYRIKGTWYFDKRQGEMKYRLLGIAPCTDKENNPQGPSWI